ncbi:carbamoyltransferase HypF [Thiohalophilus thiocyanatoxydans]|uniref:Carbamoyltransferase HypF n=1 Tax=Thiohalophilus thiocyanatoxydans TaxID=381308 RepID=A0A4R8IRE4_9GAMM|nr:carbamoyltransferase HypF [Thiohalophilus thiocyanatoxydans]TDY00069.1 hydrogenase maturation protein HypF [Thiohalophilus thiocyanatoxydans]
MQQRREFIIKGRVQGVGMRPFIYQLATGLQLGGWVRNLNGSVQLQLEGDQQAIHRFVQLLKNAPPLTAHPVFVDEQLLEPTHETGFRIRSSRTTTEADIHVPPDYFLCPDCLRELNAPGDRRYAYPFINCASCGPRYTLIRQLPYDRPNTGMADFPLCPACHSEYTDPMQRRFHAEPVACPECGPQLSFENLNQSQQGSQALQTTLELLQLGELVLIKGIGGYHLCCDATNSEAVEHLRQRKQRPHKPLALMFPSVGDDELDAVRAELHVEATEAAVLRSPARPIVLLRKRPDSRLPGLLAPGMQELGVMLPYSPLHYLLLARLERPIVATSANLPGEPVLTDAGEVNRRLADVTPNRLHHNRPIVRPADDPLVRLIQQRIRPLRLGRGTAPLELELPQPLPRPLLACGGHMKNSVALAWEQRIVISPHVGDLDSPRSRETYARTIADLQQLYAVQATSLVCDHHRGYFGSQWAAAQPLPTCPVWHHHAHAAVLAGEYPQESRWLVFTWDGVGLGEDSTLWGGEALLGRPGDWQRVGSWQPFRLPGAERAAREPWRTALGVCWQSDTRWPGAPAGVDLLYGAWQKGLNSPLTSAVGRLFDAAAALLGLCQRASFEGQAPMWLEQLAWQGEHPGIELPLVAEGPVWRSDWMPLLAMLLDESLSTADRAHAFHASLARALLAQASELKQQHGDFAIGLSGGVFQNRLLCELIMQQSQKFGLRIYLPQQVPVNDAGLCYGQIIEARARLQSQ